jgi:hypothetical protein
MNYGELKTYLSAYVSRTDLTSALYDTWYEIAAARMSKDARVTTLDKMQNIVNPAGEFVQPTVGGLIMQELVSVSVLAQGRYAPLKAVSWEDLTVIAGSAAADDSPIAYCMYSTGFKVAPGDQADHTFNVVFKAIDNAPTSDGSTPELLAKAPQLVIDAMLIEVYKYLRDVDGEALATQRYDKEALSYSNYYDWQHSGANPEARGAFTCP